MVTFHVLKTERLCLRQPLLSIFTVSDESLNITITFPACLGIGNR